MASYRAGSRCVPSHSHTKRVFLVTSVFACDGLTRLSKKCNVIIPHNQTRYYSICRHSPLPNATRPLSGAVLFYRDVRYMLSVWRAVPYPFAHSASIHPIRSNTGPGDGIKRRAQRLSCRSFFLDVRSAITARPKMQNGRARDARRIMRSAIDLICTPIWISIR